MSFWREVAKAAVQGLVESFASAAGSHIADKLLGDHGQNKQEHGENSENGTEETGDKAKAPNP